MSSVSRRPRDPLPSAQFAQLELRERVWRPEGRRHINLRWRARADSSHLFFASATGRLTPASMTVPCLYLAPDEATSFYELYGDHLAAAKSVGTTFVLTDADVGERCFYDVVGLPELRIYDLTHKKSVLDVGLDLGTLYYPNINYAREFAQRIHDHPQHFDGIRYQSRHTLANCLVIWATHHPESRRAQLRLRGSIADRLKLSESEPGIFGLFGAEIGVARPQG